MRSHCLPAEFPGLRSPRLQAGTTWRDADLDALAASLEQVPGSLHSVLLQQVHGIQVQHRRAGIVVALPAPADAVWTADQRTPCIVRTADCLPVLLVNAAQTCVAAVHAGWRGLCAGILEATIADVPAAAGDLHAWLGPAIGPERFEVGPEVRSAFLAHDAAAAAAFRPGAGDRWFADLYALARQRLHGSGVPPAQVSGGGLCTFSDPVRWHSYRREPGHPGRMLSFIQLT